MAIGNFPEIIQNNKVSNAGASAAPPASVSGNPTNSTASGPATEHATADSNAVSAAAATATATAASIASAGEPFAGLNVLLARKDSFTDSAAIIESLKRNYSFHLMSISNNHNGNDSGAVASEQQKFAANFVQCLPNDVGDTSDDEMPPLTDDESDDEDSSNYSNDYPSSSNNGDANSNNDNSDDDDDANKNKANSHTSINDADPQKEINDEQKTAENEEPRGIPVTPTNSSSNSKANSLKTHLARNQIMLMLIRIVCNSLVSQFPIDTCCNNRNNLMLNNLIVFVKTILTRSKTSIDEFLISHIHLMRFISKYNKLKNFSNNNKTRKLCLRRLILTVLMISAGHNRKSYKFNDEAYSINSFWSLVSGLSNKELSVNVGKFKAYIGNDALVIQNHELVNYKVKLNKLTKMIIKSEY